MTSSLGWITLHFGKRRVERASPHYSWIHLSMSVGHGFAGGENGYAVSGGRKRSEGLRGRKARRYAGRVVRRLTRSPRPRFRGDFCFVWSCNFGSVLSGLPNCLSGARILVSAGPLQRSREFDDRLTTPAGATSTPSMITVMTETPSGMDRNINGIIGIYCQGIK